MNNNRYWLLLEHSVVRGVLGIIAITAIWVGFVQDVEAVPAFARKYDVSCNVCHTRQPRLNPYGQRFLENGYQLPGTADGGRKEKYLFGGETNGVTLDDISNIMAVRVRADVQQASLRQNTSAVNELGVSDDPDIVFPRTLNLFFAGTATRNISFFFEGEYDTQDSAESSLAFERSILMFDNLFGQQNGTFKIGIFAPSSLYAFPTHRQQLNPIKVAAETSQYPPTIGRVPLLPLAFASKMFGLTTGQGNTGSVATDPDTLKEGFAILPFEPYLFNAPSQKGASLHGRFNDNFLYQIGVAQNKTAENTSNTRWDSYVMLRYDSLGKFSNFQVSAFYYNAPKAAMPALNPAGTIIYATEAVDWNRYGIGARWQYEAWDIYGTVIWDEIDTPVFGGAPANLSVWDTDAKGVSVEADYLLTDKWLLGIRYDQMDTGGLSRLPPALQGSDPEINQDASFLAAIAKYYPTPNIGLYARYHQNLESSVKLPSNVFGGSEHPATNLKSMVTVGVDMAF